MQPVPRRALALSDAEVTTSEYILAINSAFNAIVSALTLCLIFYMFRTKSLKPNLYLKCISLMTFYQMLYDCSLFAFVRSSNSTTTAAEVTFLFGTVLGGFGAAAWSLMVLLSPIYTVMTDKIATPRQEKIVFFAVHFALILYVILTWLLSERANNPISLHYSEVRIWMIIFDILAFAWMAYLFRARVKTSSQNQNPLYHVLRRLVPYPIIQIVTRLGAVCFNTAHGYSEMIKQPANGQSVLLFIGVFLTPAAGFGAFVAFLYLQNGATTQLKRMLSCDCSPQPPTTADDSLRDGRSQSRSSSAADRGLSTQEENLPSDQYSSFQDAAYGSNPDQWTRLSIMDEAELMQKFLETNESASNSTSTAAARAGLGGAQAAPFERGSSLASNNLEMNAKIAGAMRPSV